MAQKFKLISEETEEQTDYGVNNGLIFTPKGWAFDIIHA